MTTSTASAPGLVDARMSLGAAALDDLFPEGDAFRQSLITYIVLLTLAAFVAAFGLFQDSTASIIGAMVIAPLGGAILAVAGALVTGRDRWLGITMTQVLLSALWVVAIGFVVSSVLPNLIVLTPALEARTQPGLLDLGVALAAGAAGAFVAARRTGSDALPGVAIAVSLVPPLATVGICLEQGRLDDAGGAAILFLTNFAAIVVVACVVFVLGGAHLVAIRSVGDHRLRDRFLVSVVALVLITIPLAWQSAATALDDLTALDAQPVVVAWLDGRDLEVTGYTVDGDAIELLLTGPTPPDDVATLADELAATLGHPVQLAVEFTQRLEIQVSASP